MADSSSLPEVIKAVQDSFVSDSSNLAYDHEVLTLEDVRRFVGGRVEVLLQRNPALLMSIIYRIDVLERKVRSAFEGPAGDAMIARITDLIIERQLEKVRMRAQYRDPEGE